MAACQAAPAPDLSSFLHLGQKNEKFPINKKNGKSKKNKQKSPTNEKYEENNTTNKQKTQKHNKPAEVDGCASASLSEMAMVDEDEARESAWADVEGPFSSGASMSPPPLYFSPQYCSMLRSYNILNQFDVQLCMYVHYTSPDCISSSTILVF